MFRHSARNKPSEYREAETDDQTWNQDRRTLEVRRELVRWNAPGNQDDPGNQT